MTAWTPHEYQLRAITEMVSKPGYGLFARPGLGKTSTTLGAYSVLKDNGAARGMLVVAPLRPVYKVWPSEVAKWADFNNLSWTILHGPMKAERLHAVNTVDLYFINYEGLAWLEKELGKFGKKPWPFDVLCLDESTKIKNTQTVRFKVCKRLRDRFSRVWELTGTPAPNGIENLFGQVYMLDGGERLGKYVTHFRREYFFEEPQRGGYSLWFPRPDTQARVQAKVADITLSLSEEDYLKLPPLLENRIEVELPADALRVYKGIEDEFFAELGNGVVTAANAAAKGMKLRQIASGGVYGTEGAQGVHDAKLDALTDLIEEQEGQPLMVAVQFKHEVDRIRRHLKLSAEQLPYLGDGVSMNRTNTIVDDWNAGRIPVLLVHPTTVSLGLNLQAGGRAMCWYSLTWNLEEFDQCVKRIHRQGQTGTVTVHYIVAVDTIDDNVLNALRAKDKTQKALMNALKLRK